MPRCLHHTASLAAWDVLQYRKLPWPRLRFLHAVNHRNLLSHIGTRFPLHFLTRILGPPSDNQGHTSILSIITVAFISIIISIIIIHCRHHTMQAVSLEQEIAISLRPHAAPLAAQATLITEPLVSHQRWAAKIRQEKHRRQKRMAKWYTAAPPIVILIIIVIFIGATVVLISNTSTSSTSTTTSTTSTIIIVSVWFSRILANLKGRFVHVKVQLVGGGAPA